MRTTLSLWRLVHRSESRGRPSRSRRSRRFSAREVFSSVTASMRAPAPASMRPASESRSARSFLGQRLGERFREPAIEPGERALDLLGALSRALESRERAARGLERGSEIRPPRRDGLEIRREPIAALPRRRSPRARPALPFPRDVSARRSQASRMASRQYERELTRPTAPRSSRRVNASSIPASTASSGTPRARHSLSSAKSFGERRKGVPRRRDERGLRGRVVAPILLGFAHRSAAGRAA